MPDKDAAGASPTWRDPKRYLWPLGLTIPLSPFLAWGLVSLLGPGAFWALGLMIMGIALPLVDKFAGVDRSNPPDEALAALDKDKYYRWCVYLFLPLQYAGLVAACYLWAHGPLGTPERIGLAVTVGVVGGVGINAAHELGHKRENVERWLSKVTLAQTLYGHFYVEHNHGHHLRVATPEDPASAKFGESFWKFLPRTMIHGLHSAWDLETRRLARSGSSPWTLRNNLFNAAAMSIVLFGALIAVFGWIVLPYLLIQAGIAIVLYEAANYLEHYGLMRTRRSDGRYAKPSHRDSWNSDHLWSNLFLYHLQRHSDHHANPVRRYQALRTVDESPQLPAGYAVMIFCSMVPPLWRKVMDQRLMDFYDGDPSLVNVDRTDRTAVRRLEKLTGARAQS
ncbi:alkane 1-monooxygenase [Rhodococcus fascians]|nr:alkane 1-monooxygenase [Rhodococcus fascians]MBY4395974.1 alkane 1-monooxygenase [Rhodococcus fascians]MBY4406715.1 alkane 1-monooxygenase [Rhodococcus fascians]MBY4420732.1 alkane 1-monooxygenase [Rhodococcus fascians]MBY4459829.1 alkane 1-monooxygenase [Rhodococcus fascians]